MFSKRTQYALLALFAAIGIAPLAQPARLDPDTASLAHGEYVWHPEVAPSGPLVVVVSLDEQRAYVYRNGIAIGVSTISSGRKGYETPPGIYTILQKREIHYSNRYDDAPMPYMERLSWDGVAMHAGKVPGYPSSHGCIRLPAMFARKLFDVTNLGVSVVVADHKTAPDTVVHPALLAPVTVDGAAMSPPNHENAYEWDDAVAATGPVSVLLSTASRRVFVYRDGLLIGSAALIGNAAGRIGGSVLYVIGNGFDSAPSALDPSHRRHRWNAYPIPTRDRPRPRVDIATSFSVPAGFAKRLYSLIVPGTTVLATDLPSQRVDVDSTPAAVLESNPVAGNNRR